MPIFTRQLRKMDNSTPEQAVREMANHIRYIQEQLEWTLSNLDSSNINEIDTSKTTIGSTTTAISGERIVLSGKNGEKFEVGISDEGGFIFAVKGKDGKQMAYLNNEGKLIITNESHITVDGGDWDKGE